MIGASKCRCFVLLSLIPLSCAARGSGFGKAQEVAGRHLHQLSQAGAIIPPLDPKSDKRFFHTDYPDNFNPKPGPDHTKKFDHPYPVVQDHETYDKDYVKDENSDDGEWQAQSEYDSLRTKLERKRHEVELAYKKEEEERRKRDDLLTQEESMHEAAKKAKEEAGKAHDDAKEAKDRLKALQGKEISNGSEDGSDKQINEAVSKVKEKMKTLENCQKQLAEAQANLKKFMKEKVEHEKDMSAARAEAQAALHNMSAQAEADYLAAMGNSSNASAAAKSLEAKDADLKKALAEAEAEHQAILEEYNKEKDSTEKVETKVQTAAEKLRKYRGEVDQNGGVTRVAARSGGGPAASAPWFAAGLLLLGCR